jgi:DNA-3-methyladenine glycosylase I
VTVFRCFGTGDPLYERYHDKEWGVPVVDEHGILERLCLEAFQSGLSWLTILRKRDAFRRAFADFDPDVVGRYGPADVKRLLADESIVRNRAKIEATIANARAVEGLHGAGQSLVDVLWAPALVEDPATAAAGSLTDLPSTTAASVGLAKQLKAAGFRFLGPTTVYASMQACGVVNDHLAQCPVRARVERQRQRAIRELRRSHR